MIKLIVFDWDDVFTSGSKEGYFKCYHETLVKLNICLDAKEERSRVMANWGKSPRDELRGLLKEHPELIDKACEIYESMLFGNTFIDYLDVIPGAIKLVEKLSKKYILCVATGLNPVILREKVIPKFNFPNVFRQVISAYDIADSEKQKPHPYMVEQILKTQNIRPDEAILVGDARGDVLMAKGAGIIPVVVLSGHLNKSEALELGVKYIIDDVSHLEDILAELDDSQKE